MTEPSHPYDELDEALLRDSMILAQAAANVGYADCVGGMEWTRMVEEKHNTPGGFARGLREARKEVEAMSRDEILKLWKRELPGWAK